MQLTAVKRGYVSGVSLLMSAVIIGLCVLTAVAMVCEPVLTRTACSVQNSSQNGTASPPTAVVATVATVGIPATVAGLSATPPDAPPGSSGAPSQQTPLRI